MRITKQTDGLMYEFYDRVRKCSFQQFKRYMDTCMGKSYEAGIREGESEGVFWNSDDIFTLITSEGVSRRTAARIVDKLLEGSGDIENSTGTE